MDLHTGTGWEVLCPTAASGVWIRGLTTFLGGAPGLHGYLPGRFPTSEVYAGCVRRFWRDYKSAAMTTDGFLPYLSMRVSALDGSNYSTEDPLRRRR